MNDKHSAIDAERAMVEALNLTLGNHKCEHREILEKRLILRKLTDEYLVPEPNLKSLAHDLALLLEEENKVATKKAVMNVVDVELHAEYNFYHDPLPVEGKLILDPLVKLLQRVNWILKQWESPILNDVIFLAQHMLGFRLTSTPLMKLLTGLELLLQKTLEWELYASKKMNSCEVEITQLKHLIIRYRKIQILSWRNLLSWKRKVAIDMDYENYARLNHAVTRQVFDTQTLRKKNVELDIF